MLRRLLDLFRMRFALRLHPPGHRPAARAPAPRKLTVVAGRPMATPNRPRLSFRVRTRDGFDYVEPKPWR